MISYSSKIVRIKHIDDDTTLGKDVYIDDFGRLWQSTTYTKENAPTGVIIGTVKNNGDIYT